jgi:signal peptidase II
MKRILVIAAALFLFDQLTKLYISHALPYAVLIPGLLRIYPFHNTNNGLLGGVFQYKSPVWANVLCQVLFTGFALVAHRYFTFVVKRRSRRLDAFLTLGIAGPSAAFIDVVFWGGSWDFIGLFDMYILDFKDFYGIIAVALFIAFSVSLIRRYTRQTKTDKAGTSFIRWMKDGFPAR